jgi:large repetitive protein
LGNVLTLALSSLTPSTNYTVAVRARDSAGNVGPSVSGSFTTLSTPLPTAPGTPVITLITTTGATATWAAAYDSLGIGGYEYSLNGGSSWTGVGTALTIALTGLTNNTAYTIKVRAFDPSGNRGPSSSVGFTTGNDIPTAPGTPAFSSVTATSATATWTAATAGDGIATYQYSLNGGSTWTSVGTALSVNLSGLTTNTLYTVSVRAQDDSGNYGPAASASFTTVDNIPPSAPGTPSFSAVTTTTATAAWTAATDSVGISSYQYSINGGSSWTSAGAALSVNLSGLTTFTTYTLYVRAIDNVGNVGPASSASFTTVDNIPPSAPGTPTFSAIGATSATATWAAATDADGVTGYQYTINGGTTWVSVGNVLSVNLTGLTPVTAYTFYVRAIDTAGNIGPNASAGFTTTAYTDTMSFTSGNSQTGTYPNIVASAGYYVNVIGALSPTTTSNGKTIWGFQGMDQVATGYTDTALSVTGFSANPGAGWLTSISVAGSGVTLTGASATSFTYSGGTATWGWPGWTAVLYSGTLTIVHN